ncbi:MAG: Co2+/Mg2+ efflux protein ApaG [Asticcacaulis sp.]|uniref:Co2+/Mg2+ efflux protein ApaG n=1 Tax=Asticcacaulis sp. TaxID=1872648 RepID=UPI0039E679AF
MFYQHTSHDITVRVEVDYVPPENNKRASDMRHVWAYHITMINTGDDTVQLKTRHWTIMDARGQVEHVNGPGVVGETPVLAPGQTYSYSSGCPLNTSSGSMSGYYMFEDEDGRPLKIIIPTFSLDLPNARRTLN